MGNEQDEPHLKAVLAEFDRGAEKKKALATVLLSQRRLHERILSEIGEFLLRKVQDVTSDFELGRLNNNVFEARDTPLILEEKWSAWGVRRRSWPRNCVIAIDSDRGQHQSIYYGVYAPDPSSKEIQKYPQSICEGRPRLERLASDVDGGRASPWWPWFKYAEPPAWGLEFAAHLILGSPNADVANNLGVQELGGTFVRLWEAVDRAFEAA